MSADTGWEGYLDPEEKILWQGRPTAKLAFQRRNPFRLLFAFFWLGFSIFWMAMAAQVNLLFAMFGLPFVAIGIFLIGGDSLFHAFVRQNTWYTLTDKRAFVAVRIFGRKGLKSFEILPETPLELDMTNPPTIWFAKHFGGQNTTRIGFEFIDEAQEVYQMMRDVKRGQA